MKSVKINIGIVVLMGAGLCYGVCDWVGLEECKQKFLDSPPWMLFPALAAAPAMVLTWYWRHMINSERLITERFAKATEMLGSEKMEQRLGAIYQLERIAQDSPRDHWTVMETLCAFVRERSPWTPQKQKWADGLENMNDEERRKRIEAIKPATDIQAAITVIGRRKQWELEEEEPEQVLDFKGADLRRIDMENGRFSYAMFNKVHLEGANLYKADMEGARFYQTNLINAFLENTVFEDADLEETNLEYADLSGANLKGTDLSDASMEEAIYNDKTVFPKTISPGEPEIFDPHEFGMINMDESDDEAIGDDLPGDEDAA